MGGEEWYRHRSWNAEIAADFERRLARARTQKAQYLRIQGSTLIGSHPDAAIELLRRCIAEGDEAFIAAAWLDIAHARYGTGDIDGTLEALGEAIAQQQREPRFRTSAPIDFAFLAALHDKAELYAEALRVLDTKGEAYFADAVFEAEAACALIFDAQEDNERAKDAARRALAAASIDESWLPGFPQVGLVPEGDTPLHARLRRIAADPQEAT